jgi:hypothetical protein
MLAESQAGEQSWGPGGPRVWQESIVKEALVGVIVDAPAKEAASTEGSRSSLT